MSQAASSALKWVPLMDYAMRRGVSLSTLRRYIKAKKVQYRVEKGRYLILDREGEENAETKNLALMSVPIQDPGESAQLQAAVKKLQKDLRKAHEEIAELKTLIAFYEEKSHSTRSDR